MAGNRPVQETAADAASCLLLYCLFVLLLWCAAPVMCCAVLCSAVLCFSRSTKPFTAVTLANVVSVVFAAPLAAGIMRINAAGLRGWQWLFIIEGIPSVILGLVMLVRLQQHGKAFRNASKPSSLNLGSVLCACN